MRASGHIIGADCVKLQQADSRAEKPCYTHGGTGHGEPKQLGIETMKIGGLRLKEFTAFSDVGFEFSPGLNVLLGANATGKSHVLKVLYSVLKAWKEPEPLNPAIPGTHVADGKHSPNPFVVPRFIGAVQRNPVIDRMNAVTTNGLGECLREMRAKCLQQNGLSRYSSAKRVHWRRQVRSCSEVPTLTGIGMGPYTSLLPLPD